MNKLQQIAKAGAGLVMLGLKAKKFDTSIFDGKRIAIVGPASSAYNTGKGSFIDSFDYVIRINKATKLMAEGKSSEDIGTKTDILFHCFFENNYSGGGPLDMALFDRLGIKYVVNPLSNFFGYRNAFNFYKKYLSDRTIYMLDNSYYQNLKAYFGTYIPTTGFSALNAALNSNFSELYITGFTFFKTPYGDGYRDEMKELEKTQKYIAESKLHDPELEYAKFKEILKLNKHKNVVLDPTLEQILATN